MEKVIELKEIGPVTFNKKNTCKNLRITVKADNLVKVTMPYGFSLETALQFVNAKKGWIKKQILKNAAFKKEPSSFDESTVFNTNRHVLKIRKHENNTIKTSIDRNHINFFYPMHVDVNDARIQAAIKKAILITWQIEAREILPSLVAKLAAEHGIKYSSVKIRNNKTRWGSCSGSNNINLNIHLVRLPRHLCEYVIMHELTHIIHKNHGESFWKMLDKMTGNARGLDKELNSYRISVW